MVKIAALILPDTFATSLSPLIDAFELTRERSSRTIAAQSGEMPEILLSLLSPDGKDVPIPRFGTLKIDMPISSDDRFDLIWIPAFRAYGEGEMRERLAKGHKTIEWLSQMSANGTLIGASGAAVAYPVAAKMTGNLKVPASTALIPVLRALFPRIRYGADLAVADGPQVLLSRGSGQDAQAIITLFSRVFSPGTGRWLRSVFGSDTMLDDGFAQSGVRDPLADRARLILEQRFTGTVSLSALAEELSVSHAMLIRHFRREVGMTPLSYIHHLRLNAARRLLVETDRTIDSIAAAIGYGDARLFREMFRKAFGTSATEWRRNERERPVEASKEQRVLRALGS